MNHDLPTPRPHRIVTVWRGDRKSTRLNSSHSSNSYAVFCLKKKNLRFTFPQHDDLSSSVETLGKQVLHATAAEAARIENTTVCQQSRWADSQRSLKTLLE